VRLSLISWGGHSPDPLHENPWPAPMKSSADSKKLFVTTYEIRESPYKFGKVLDIYNGFSYVTPMIEADHLLMNIEKDITPEDENLINTYDTVYCSLHKRLHFKKLKKYRDWIFGGPAAFELTDNKERIKVLDIPFEYHLGREELSHSFDLYWNRMQFREVDDPSQYIVRFSCSLGFGGCYWNNCVFCVYTYQKKYIERTHVDQILAGFPEERKYKYAIVFISINSIPLRQLKILVDRARELEEKNYQIQTFLRLDEELIDYLLSIDFKVTNVTFRVGLESFSQKAVNILNKNISIRTFLKSLKLIEKGFKMNYNLLRRFNFADKECYEEAKEVVKEIPRSDQIMFSFWENIHWRRHNREAMEEFVWKYGGQVQSTGGAASFIIVPGKTADYYNKKICEIYDSLPHLKVYFDNLHSRRARLADSLPPFI
jgi:hypothetical protein